MILLIKSMIQIWLLSLIFLWRGVVDCWISCQSWNSHVVLVTNVNINNTTWLLKSLYIGSLIGSTGVRDLNLNVQFIKNGILGRNYLSYKRSTLGQFFHLLWHWTTWAVKINWPLTFTGQINQAPHAILKIAKGVSGLDCYLPTRRP